jgi:hypothetical protein
MNACFVAVSLLLAWDVPPGPPVPAPQRNVYETNPPAAQQNRIVAPVTIQRGGIRGEGRTVQAKITIPRALLPSGNEAAVGAAAPAAPAPPASAAPTGSPAPRIQLIPPPKTSSTPPLGSVIAGIAMSLAAVSLVFIIRGSPRKKAVYGILLGGAIGLTAFGIARADIAGQRRVRPPNAPPETEIVIEVSDFGDAVTLQLVR